MGTGTNHWQGSRGTKGVLGLIAATAAFFVFAAPAMAASPTFNHPPAFDAETDGPGGWEVNITASDDTDPSVEVVCGPPGGYAGPAQGDLLPVGGPHTVNCLAIDDSADPSPDNFGSFQVTVTDTARSDLEIDKFASHLKASPGQNVTYSFKVTNHGPSPATGVTVRDPISKHLTYISNPGGGCPPPANGELVCTVPGTLGVGASHTFNVVLQLHPTHHQGEAPSEHDLDILKFEQFVEPPPNNSGIPYFKHTMSCPAGYTATDGSARTDSAQDSDQPGVSHAVERVHTVRSRSNPANRQQWDFTLQNHNLGQAQVHLFIVCLRDSTSNNDGHSHTFNYTGPFTGTLIIPTTGGRHETTLTCPGANDVAIAPGFDFRFTTPPFAEDGPHGPMYRSTQSADGRSWTFGFQTAAAARVVVSIRCLSRYTNPAAGHTETLNFHHVYGRDVVAPFAGFGNSGPWTEVRRECPVHYKGITATWRYPRHVSPMGNTPEPLIRDFRVFNKSPHAKYAHTDLMCLKNRTRDDLNGGSVRNTASTYGNQPDWIFGNNIDFFDLEDPPLDPSGTGGSGDGGGTGGGSGGGSGGSGDGSGGSGSGDGSGGGGSAADGGKQTLRLGDKVTHSGRTAMIPLYGGDDPSDGTVSLDAGNNHLGDADFDLDADEDAFVDVKLSKKGKKLLKNRRFVHVTVDSGGESNTQRLGVEH